MSHLAGVIPVDIADGIGVRVGVFLSGCPHHCPGCFNQEAWDYDYGRPITDATIAHVTALLGRPFIDGLSLLGGEPLAPNNAAASLSFVRAAKALHKSVWIYTGYAWEELPKIIDPYNTILHLTDVLVDGRFDQALADKTLLFRGSSNQRLIDVPQTLKQGHVILWEGKT